MFDRFCVLRKVKGYREGINCVDLFYILYSEGVKNLVRINFELSFIIIII